MIGRKKIMVGEEKIYSTTYSAPTSLQGKKPWERGRTQSA